MNFVRAIETFSNPSIPIPEVAHEIVDMDTPDKNWRGQARTAESHLTKLVKELATYDSRTIGHTGKPHR